MYTVKFNVVVFVLWFVVSSSSEEEESVYVFVYLCETEMAKRMRVKRELDFSRAEISRVGNINWCDAGATRL